MPQKLEIDDFSGGVTDYYLNAPANKLRHCDNLLLVQQEEAGKPFTRPGSTLYSVAAPQVVASRISSLILYKNTLIAQSAKKLYYFVPSIPAWFTGASFAGTNLFDKSDANTSFTTAPWNDHILWASSAYDLVLKTRLGTNDSISNDTAGLPKPTVTSITQVANGGGVAGTFLFKLVITNTYITREGVRIETVSEPSLAKPYFIGTDNDIVGISHPTLVNASDENYPLLVSTYSVYRTLANGSVFYLAQINNGPIAASSGSTILVSLGGDLNQATKPLLYTEGGVQPNNLPPRASLVHVVGDIAYYANIFGGGTTYYRYRIMQSVPGAIDAVPGSFFLDLDDNIIGLSSTRGGVVALCQNSVYRIDGFFDELGRGGMTEEKISEGSSCVSGQSVVQTLEGVFWAGREGIYWSDSYQVKKLNQDYDKTWKTFISTDGEIDALKCSRIQGKYDRKKNRVWWTIASTNGSQEVDACYVLDLNFGVRDNATFTTVSGLESFAPSAIEFDTNGALLRADSRGYMFKHSDTVYTDPKVDVSISPALWVNQTIFYNLESIAFNFGTSFLRKYVTGVNVVADSVTNLALQITSNNDDDKSVAELLPIRYRGNVTWGDPDLYWGDGTVPWNQDGLLIEKRRMPAKNLRCSYKSVAFTNAYITLFTSDVLGTADVDANAKTVALTNAVVVDWPANSVDWYISFASDGYTNDYLITTRNDDVLVYADPLSQSVSATASKWEIKGYPKGEILNLLNYALHYEIFGQTQGVFNKADTGDVGTT